MYRMYFISHLKEYMDHNFSNIYQHVLRVLLGAIDLIIIVIVKSMLGAVVKNHAYTS